MAARGERAGHLLTITELSWKVFHQTQPSAPPFPQTLTSTSGSSMTLVALMMRYSVAWSEIFFLTIS